jgi:Protein of unknown function (DUF2568)
MSRPSIDSTATKRALAPAVAANVALRGVMEAGVVAAFGYWGYRHGGGALSRTVLAIGVPAIGFGIWGAVDFHQLGRLAEPTRLVEELALSGLAAIALWMVDQRMLGVALGAVSVVHHLAVYATGERLLKHVPPAVQ